MDIASVAASVSAAQQARTGDAVTLAVLRKTLDLQAQNAQQLIAALPEPAPAAASNPPHLGNSVNEVGRQPQSPTG